jgi:hypothetical protein
MVLSLKTTSWAPQNCLSPASMRPIAYNEPQSVPNGAVTLHPSSVFHMIRPRYRHMYSPQNVVLLFSLSQN